MALDSNIGTITVIAATTIARWAATLSSGQSVSMLTSAGGIPVVPMPSVNWGVEDFNWQGHFDYDPVNARVLLWGKQPSGNPYRLQTYSLSSNTWTSAYSVSSDIGHIYGNNALDPATGDGYQQRWGNNQLLRYDGASGAMSFPPPSTTGLTLSTSVDAAPQNGLGWHPNLYGSGDGGLVLATQSRLVAWRKSTNTWATIETHSNHNNLYYGQAAYLPGSDRLVFISQTSQPIRYITPGPVVTSASNTLPINVQAGGSGDRNHLIRHPSNTGKLLVLEYPASGSDVYESSNGVNWTQISDHPFTVGSGSSNITYCSMYEHGVVWGLSGTNMSKLWKP